jgi:tetratricopeptide (TPR) repeat protein
MKKIALLLTVVFVFSLASLYAQTAQTRLDNGKRLFDQGNYNGAIQELNEAIRLDPNMAEAYAYRARSYDGSDYDRALSDANRAIQLNPRLAIAYNTRGNVFLNKNKDYDRAITEYTEAIRLDPQFATAYYNRGIAYYAGKKDYDRAIADYTQAIRLDPNYASAYYNRGLAYHDKYDYDRAKADYEAALRINPNHTNAKNELANLKQAQEQTQAQTITQGGVRVTPLSTGSTSLFGRVLGGEDDTRATFLLENTTSQTKRVLIVLQIAYQNLRDSFGTDAGIQNSPEYTLAPNEKRQVIVPLPRSQGGIVQDSSGTSFVGRTVRIREIIVY